MAFFVMALLSCNTNKQGDKNDTPIDSVDKAVSDSLNAVEDVLLPDTSYSSADMVKYIIEVKDSAGINTIGENLDLYSKAPGVFTFRKGVLRQANFDGYITGTPTDFTVDWTFVTDTDNRDTGYGKWGGGTGWTGQPLYVSWPDTCIARFKSAGLFTENFGKQEIILGSLASKVYFINYHTGKASRKPINVGNPIKGTISLDPTLNGNLYVGHGVPAQKPWGVRVVDLYSHRITWAFNEDTKAFRQWHAFDSSSLRIGNFVFLPGENGSVYKCSVAQGQLSIAAILRYTVNGVAPGIESSMAAYCNYGYLCDNHGNVICINLINMKPVWRNYTGDDTDATPVVVLEDNTPYLYVGCEIDRQQQGHAKFMKINGLSGETVWAIKVNGKRIDRDSKHFDGGFYSTALPGMGNCSDLIFVNCVTNTDGQNGVFMAINKSDGSIKYKTTLKYYSWSSPVGFVNEKGRMYIVTGDSAGNLYLIDGYEGDILISKRVGNNFESSPVVIGNSIVIGSRGNEVYKVSIK